METIYQTPHEKFSRFPFEGNTPVQAEFLQTRSVGDYNLVTYCTRKQESTRSESREQIYFIPDAGKEKEVARELVRGRTFFTKKDGILIGVMLELYKLGKVVKIAC